MRFSSTPMPSISMRTVSPAFRYCGGFMPMPTPAGVPLAIKSPGCKVMPREMVSISVGIPKIKFAVLASCHKSPLTQQRTCTALPSIACAVTAHGPIGQKVSKDLPKSHCWWRICTSRAVTSFTME